MLYAQALIADEQYISAESVLESQSKLRPQDTHVFLLAETAGLASNVTGVHLARAEYFICTVHYIVPFSTWNMLSDWCANRTQY